jgi:isopenicillin-N N-acyltransferase-like protein
LNSEGLGLVIAGLVSNRDAWDRLGLPFHARTWQVLNSRTLAAAREAALQGARSCSANFLIGHDETGEVLDLEVGTDNACGLPPEAGLLAHTNHFLDPDALGIWQPLDATTTSSVRLERLQLLLRANRGRLDEARLRTVLADHDGYPSALCGHPNPLFPPDEQYATAFSAILDLHERTMLAAYGNPCRAPFVRHSLGA